MHQAGGQQVLGPPENRRGATDQRDGRQVGEEKGAGGGGEQPHREHQGAEQGCKRGEDPEGDVGAGQEEVVQKLFRCFYCGQQYASNKEWEKHEMSCDEMY